MQDFHFYSSHDGHCNFSHSFFNRRKSPLVSKNLLDGVKTELTTCPQPTKSSSELSGITVLLCNIITWEEQYQINTDWLQEKHCEMFQSYKSHCKCFWDTWSYWSSHIQWTLWVQTGSLWQNSAWRYWLNPLQTDFNLTPPKSLWSTRAKRDNWQFQLDYACFYPFKTEGK